MMKRTSLVVSLVWSSVLLFISIVYQERNMLTTSRLLTEGSFLLPGQSDPTPKRTKAQYDSICGSCRHKIAFETKNTVTRCGVLMFEMARDEKNVSLAEAAEKVYQKYPEDCAQCHNFSDNCSHLYYRYDEMTPRIKYSVSHQLSSLAEHRVAPASAFANLDAYFAVEENQFKKYLFEYNPSIVKIPSTMRHRLPADAVYAASYRVTTRNSCFGLEHLKLMKAARSKDMVGFALLRADLSIIVDCVVPFIQLGNEYRVEDSRLFVRNDILFYTTYSFTLPIRLHYNENQTTKLTNEFPSLLSISIDTALESRFPSCENNTKATSAKNWNYFVDSITNETMVEVWPDGPHVVKHADLVHNKHFCEGETSTISDDISYTTPSFATVEELHYPTLWRDKELFSSRDRGTACCVSINYGERSYYVGVSHTKTPYRLRPRFPDDKLGANRFVSRFYAFDATTPYRIKTRSGYFCLGFENDEEELEKHPLARYKSRRRTLWVGEDFDCPTIHFVSGMVEKAGDSDTVILGYGINDCTARFVEIDKVEIIRLLFSPHEHGFVPSVSFRKRKR